jgi:hypothetical protein
MDLHQRGYMLDSMLNASGFGSLFQNSYAPNQILRLHSYSFMWIKKVSHESLGIDLIDT